MLNSIDMRIVQILRNNARLPNKTLAQRVGIAASTCLERVRRMREQGVIRGYFTDLDPKALGIGLQAMVVVQLGRHSRPEVESFHDAMLALPEVIALYHVAGKFDFLVHVVARDSDSLRDLVLRAFTERPEVKQIETHLIFEYRRSNGLVSFASADD